MDTLRWIFLSPHLDDVALSCGGLVWDLAHQGHQVEIWSLMSGFPPDEAYSEFAQQNHLTWGMSGEAAIRMRRSEDRTACQILGAKPRHFDWPDAIYRRDPKSGKPLVCDNETLFGTSPETWLVDEISQLLQKEIPDETWVVSPAGVGNHVDHLAVTLAAQPLKRSPSFYADYPYILKHHDWPDLHKKTFSSCPHLLNEDSLRHWQEAVLAYPSQITQFWEYKTALRLAYRNYMAGGGGRLWQLEEHQEV